MGLADRRRSGWWATALAGLLAAGAATAGALRWRKARQTPQSRARRAWLGVKRQVRRTTARMR
jgi:hypothetical protein